MPFLTFAGSPPLWTGRLMKTNIRLDRSTELRFHSGFSCCTVEIIPDSHFVRARNKYMVGLDHKIWLENTELVQDFVETIYQLPHLAFASSCGGTQYFVTARLILPINRTQNRSIASHTKLPLHRERSHLSILCDVRFWTA